MEWKFLLPEAGYSLDENPFEDIKGCIRELYSQRDRREIFAIRNKVLRSLPGFKQSMTMRDLLTGSIGLVLGRLDAAKTRVLAYHEAGHAVAAYAFDRRIVRIIMPGKGFFTSGAVMTDGPTRSGDAVILGNLSGCVAASYVTPGTGIHPLWGACGDFASAHRSSILRLYDAPIAYAGLLTAYIPPTQRLLKSQEQALHALASVLIDRRWMCGYEAEQILDESWDHSAPVEHEIPEEDWFTLTNIFERAYRLEAMLLNISEEFPPHAARDHRTRHRRGYAVTI